MPWEGAPITVDQPMVETPKTSETRLLSQEDALPLFKTEFNALEQRVRNPELKVLFSEEKGAEEEFDRVIGHLRDQIGDRLRVTMSQKAELLRWVIDETRRISSGCSPQAKRGFFRSLVQQFSPVEVVSIIDPSRAKIGPVAEEIIAFLEQPSSVDEAAPSSGGEVHEKKIVSVEKKQEINQKAQLMVDLLNQLTEKANLLRLDASGASEDEVQEAFRLVPEEEITPALELLSWLGDQADEMDELPNSLHHLNLRYLKSGIVDRLVKSGAFNAKKRLRQLQAFIATDEEYQTQKPEKIRSMEQQFLLDVASEDLANRELPTTQRLRALEILATSFGEEDVYRKELERPLIEKGVIDLSEREDLSIERFLSVCEALVKAGLHPAFVNPILEKQAANIPEGKFEGLRKAAAEAKAIDRLLKAQEFSDLFLQQVEPVLNMLRKENAPSADSERKKIADAFNAAFSKLPAADARRIFESFPADLREKTYDHRSLMYDPAVAGRRAEGLDQRGEALQEKIRETSRRNAERIQNELAQAFSRESVQNVYEEMLKNNQITINVPVGALEAILAAGRVKSAFEEGAEKGASYLERRYDAEKLLGIRNLEFYQDSPAIYGAIASGGEEDRFGAAPSYGNICLRLKKATIAPRVTCVDGDSFEYRDNMDDNRYLYEDALWVKTQNVLQMRQRGSTDKRYVECQILGGVNVDEIEAIVVSTRFKSEVESVMEKFPAMKIEFVDEPVHSS